MVKIKEGYGMTRDGRKVKIERNGDDVDIYPFSHDSGNGSFHAITATGKSCIDSDQDDIISIIDDDASGPVRTVTRLEPVEGKHGIVQLDVHNGQIVVTISPEDGHQPSGDELRSAAMILSQIAEYRDEVTK